MAIAPTKEAITKAFCTHHNLIPVKDRDPKEVAQAIQSAFDDRMAEIDEYLAIRPGANTKKRRRLQREKSWLLARRPVSEDEIRGWTGAFMCYYTARQADLEAVQA